MSLLTLSQAAPLLGCRDPRTARKRLAALGVPVVDVTGRVLVDEGELRRAIRANARPLSATADTPRPAGVALRPGERLWDGPGEISVGRRRANAPARGGQEQVLRASPAYRGHLGGSGAGSSSPPRQGEGT